MPQERASGKGLVEESGLKGPRLSIRMEVEKLRKEVASSGIVENENEAVLKMVRRETSPVFFRRPGFPSGILAFSVQPEWNR